MASVFPVGVNSYNVNEAHLINQVFYTKTALDRLMKKFVYRSVFEKYILPQNSGMSVQMFRWNNLSPSLALATEGDVPTSLTLSSRVVRCSVSRFSSFVSITSFHQATAPTDEIAAASELLGYRAGYTMDNLHRGVIDDQASSCTLALLGPTFAVQDVRNVRTQLQALDVQPFEDNNFLMFLHPYVSYDLVNDPAANGLADISKYNTDVKNSPLFRYEDRGRVTEVAGCMIKETTSVFSQTVSSVNYYRVYAFGKGALGRVDLEGYAPSDITDPKSQKFKINTWRSQGINGFDPTGELGGIASYNFATGATWLDGPEGIGGVHRARVLDAPSTVA